MELVVNMHDAKTRLSKLVALAQRGESVTIRRRGKPMARLVPIKPQPVLPMGAFAPMPDDEAAAWGL